MGFKVIRTILAIVFFLINVKAFPEQDNQEWQEARWEVFYLHSKYSGWNVKRSTKLWTSLQLEQIRMQINCLFFTRRSKYTVHTKIHTFILTTEFNFSLSCYELTDYLDKSFVTLVTTYLTTLMCTKAQKMKKRQNYLQKYLLLLWELPQGWFVLALFILSY